MQVSGSEQYRKPMTKNMNCDLAIIGGGMAGTCCAITAARQGLKVVLIQDRPVLGGNASSEVRLWILGATSHMSNNNRWAREGGVIDEILVENTYKNPEGNPIIFDTILLEKVTNEDNIELLLNTSVFEVVKKNTDQIKSVKAFCSQNSTQYQIEATYFCDASGDGIVGFMAGAAFRMGAESKDEFGEKFAPDESFGHLLGHSLYFYSKDTGKPVDYKPPSYAISMEEVEKIARFRKFGLQDQGCKFWWIEYGGRLDTVHETENIKWELWRIVYGVWNYFKNSGKYPEAETMTLEWVGMIPGKRESRRFEGDYILIQQDIVEQRIQYDAVSAGGWALDLHPSDGVYSDQPGCEQWHARGVYQVPYRIMYSRNITNLFLAGRIISASHVAFGSTRVMATCAHNAQAVGVAAAICKENDWLPARVSAPENITKLQQRLLQAGQYIPEVPFEDLDDLVQKADIQASSQLIIEKLNDNGPWLNMKNSWAMLLPLKKGNVPEIELTIKSDSDTTLKFELRKSRKIGNYTPDHVLSTREALLKSGAEQKIKICFDSELQDDQYVFFCLLANENVWIKCSDQRITGLLAVTNKFNERVAKSNVQKPEQDIGVDVFEFWRPLRRPAGHNFAIRFNPAVNVSDPGQISNGFTRPVNATNAWVAAFDDTNPNLALSWNEKQPIKRIELTFDTDFDHPMESVLMGHPENVMPFCVRNYRIKDDKGDIIKEVKGNYQSRNTIVLDNPVTTSKIIIEAEHPSEKTPAAIFQVCCYSV